MDEALFDEDCKEAVKQAHQLRRLYTRFHGPGTCRRYARARNHKKREVSRVLQQGHRRGVQEASEDGPRGMWWLAKWARQRKEAYK